MTTPKLLKLSAILAFLGLLISGDLALAVLDENATAQKGPAIVPGEAILKFKDDAVVGAVANDLVERGQPFKGIVGDNNLDRLNAKYKLKSMQKVFGNSGQSSAVTAGVSQSVKPITLFEAEQRHTKDRVAFSKKILKLHQKRLLKNNKPLNTPVPDGIPYLEHVYKLVVDNDADINKACQDYAQDPRIEYCQPNYRVQVQWVPNDPYYSSTGSWGQTYDDLWGLKQIQMAAAWDVSKGAGTVVAVVDTGVDYNHPDIAANIWSNPGEIANNGIDDDHNGYIDDQRGWDFSNNDKDPMDDHGHGTHCAGTVAAIGNNGIGIIGVAPQTKIMPIKALDQYGGGDLDVLASAIVYAADQGADVISNSWGCFICPSNPSAEQAVKYAHDLGAVVVFAAGNSAADVMNVSPQNQKNTVITVAANSELNKRSYFSNFGMSIAVSAPGGGEDGASTNFMGRNILSLRAGTTDLYGDGKCILGIKYFRARGTSMACPHVAGLAALILSKNPAFTPDDVSQVIRSSTDDIESPGFDFLTGFGRVNAPKALAIDSVPRVRIASSGLMDVSGPKVTISGTAAGPNFQSYRLYYASLDMIWDEVKHNYNPVIGAWQPLTAASVVSVDNGVLASVNSTLFALHKSYLLNLEVTTTNGKKFSEVAQVLTYLPQSNPSFLLFSESEQFLERTPVAVSGEHFFTNNYKDINTALSDFEHFNGSNNTTTARMIDYYGMSARSWDDYVVYNSDLGEMTALNVRTGGTRTFPYSKFFDVNENRLIIIAGGDSNNPLFNVYDLSTGAMVQSINLNNIRVSEFIAGHHLAANSEKNFSLAGDYLAVAREVGPINSPTSQSVILYHIPTKTVTTLASYPQGPDETYNDFVDGLWIRGNYVIWQRWSPATFISEIFVYNIATSQLKIIHPGRSLQNWTTDGKTILWSEQVMLNEQMQSIIFSYDIATGQTALFNSEGNFGDVRKLVMGKNRVYWRRLSASTQLGKLFTSDKLPVFASLSNQTVFVTQPLSVPVSATDAEGDKINLSAVGGTWPNSTTALPAGATFTDNGNGTGTFKWTPQSVGTYNISFLARDFIGRKGATWNTVKTIKVTVAPLPFDYTVSATPINGIVPAHSQFDVFLPADGNQYTVSVNYGDGKSSPAQTSIGSAFFGHAYMAPGTYTATVSVTNSLNQTVKKFITLTVTGTMSAVGWHVYAQAPNYEVWGQDGGDNRSYRVLIKGSSITKSGTKLRLRFKGTYAYKVQKVSVVQRDATTLNGVDATWAKVTFGASTWETGGQVPANSVLYSNWVPFTVTAGKDLFVSMWTPAGNRIPYMYEPTSGNTSWATGAGVDWSGRIDWAGGTFPIIRSNIDGVEVIEVSN